MAELSFIRLPKPVTGESLTHQASCMRPLRLLSLQTDPASFITQYEDEVDQPLQFSIDRMKNPVVEHFVTTTGPQPIEGSGLLSTEGYIAFLAMVYMKASDTNESREYLLSALYVHPDHRRRGIMSRLIRVAIEWVSAQSRQDEIDKLVMRVTVAEENVSARNLYEKLKFEEDSHTFLRNKVGGEIPVVNMKLHLTL